jgi:signal transduction histidine kinase
VHGHVPRIPIRLKLAAASAVPLLGLLLLSAAEVRQAASETDRVRSDTELATSSTGPAGVISRVQDERSWAIVELSGLESAYPVAVTGYGPTRRASDEAIGAFRADVESTGGTVAATYRDALAALGGLEDIRRDIDRMPGPRTLQNTSAAIGVYDRYAGLIDGLLDASAGVSRQVRDTDLRQGAALATRASHQLELLADVLRTTAFSALLSPGGVDTPAEVTEIATSLSAFDANNVRIERATGRYAPIVRELYPGELARRVQDNVRTALRQRTIIDLPTFLETAVPPPGSGYFALRDAFIDALVERAEGLQDRASTRQRLFTALALGTFVLAALATWLVSRSITRPLRSLTRQATDVARHRLPAALREILETPPDADVRVPDPAPVAVRTRDEVADVAAALDTAQRSALDLAAGQAVLRRNVTVSIVSLGRRNRALLGRQLDFLASLTAPGGPTGGARPTAPPGGEVGPDRAASLFRVAHLATRMRRNAESLLVLAGIHPPPRWTGPLPIDEVVRTALGEVEDYARVRVDVAPAMVAGSAAADLAHLLAELLENAVTFSPPEAHVVLRGWWRGPDVLRLAVIDRGLGMPAAALDQANHRLGGGPATTALAPSRYLGHHVAGRLADRHELRVRLDALTPRGTIATVDVPAELATPAVPEAGPPGAVPGVPVGGAGVPLGGAGTAAADDVYGYLTSFATGVRRGLDESARNRARADPAPGRPRARGRPRDHRVPCPPGPRRRPPTR